LPQYYRCEVENLRNTRLSKPPNFTTSPFPLFSFFVVVKIYVILNSLKPISGKKDRKRKKATT
ncbi:MAG: hypothetical protein AABZ43_01045, partial [Planctomycetota bacterium]